MTSRRQWRAAVVLVHLCVYLAATQDEHKALFPSAYRIRRGTFSLQNPAFQRSPGDADLLFELLLTGMQILDQNAAVWIPDRELASLRRVRHLEVICEDLLPKSLPDVRRLTAELDRRRRRPLGGRDFERTVLTLVFAAQMLGRVTEVRQKEVWAEAVIRLFTAVQRDLGVF